MEQKTPTKEELRQRLKAVKTRGYLSRLPQKLREHKIETIKTNIDNQRNQFLEQMKSHFTPEQMQQLLNGNVQFKVTDELVNNVTDVSNASEETPISIPINLPKMSPVNNSNIKTEI
jgi:hypothetical protein